MKSRFNILAAAIAVAVFAGVAAANHSWGNYHWARTANPFTIKLGDNVSAAWDGYLATSHNDWSQSNVLDTTIVAGQAGRTRKCSPTSGRVEVCNDTYGRNGWLGIASVWASGSHITQGTVKLNDTYYNMASYNTPAWRNLVMCQEIGHTFGLAHQDENFNNPNLGTCMDYTNSPESNQHPNNHDYQQLSSIYSHLDSSTTVGFTLDAEYPYVDTNNPGEWGRAISANSDRTQILFERDLGHGRRLFTFVYWVEERGNRH